MHPDYNGGEKNPSYASIDYVWYYDGSFPPDDGGCSDTFDGCGGFDLSDFCSPLFDYFVEDAEFYKEDFSEKYEEQADLLEDLYINDLFEILNLARCKLEGTDDFSKLNKTNPFESSATSHGDRHLAKVYVWKA
ncbi:hypothetical protein HME9304_01969 [Flagellimonas maritima]|uniref:Uncharacterized protein n=2 Tax=Flagellimonas maritima TaxID=1383885 RepID=A0A2Z4LT08_9FLAO|nr:hypothetical protein HME9304_01969 [Allomuricauda aurantiaca]